MARSADRAPILEISVADQQLLVVRNGQEISRYAVSTARNGTGCEEGSNCTPTGNFQIAEKLGEDANPGTIFKGRQPVGAWVPEQMADEDLVLTRILWLDGVDQDNANTRQRYIYIHGTNHEDLIGQPVSHGCVRMRNQDIIELFDLIPVGTKVRIV